MTTPVTPKTKARVLDYLVAEADMDGLVTTVGREVADAVEIHQTAAVKAIRQLEADGSLAILRRSGSNGRTTEIQLAEQVLA